MPESCSRDALGQSISNQNANSRLNLMTNIET